MRFLLLDRVVEVSQEESRTFLRGYRNLTLGEEYLADHFPTFPVMPGVLMLQTLVEAGSWLLRATNAFSHSVTVLREVRGVKYGTFMEPGRRLEVTVELVERSMVQGEARATLKGRGEVEGQVAVSARLSLASYNLADRDPSDPTLADTDTRLVEQLRHQWAWLSKKQTTSPQSPT